MTKNEMLNKLLINAKALQENAYVPYSKFRVAAIVSLNNETEIYGVNVENASYPVSICAERVALAQLITLGYKKQDIKSLFLITDSDLYGSPCGMCRQFMVEIMPPTAEVFIAKRESFTSNDIKTILVTDLLPFAFLPESLLKEEK